MTNSRSASGVCTRFPSTQEYTGASQRIDLLVNGRSGLQLPLGLVHHLGVESIRHGKRLSRHSARLRDGNHIVDRVFGARNHGLCRRIQIRDGRVTLCFRDDRLSRRSVAGQARHRAVSTTTDSHGRTLRRSQGDQRLLVVSSCRVERGQLAETVAGDSTGCDTQSAEVLEPEQRSQSDGRLGELRLGEIPLPLRQFRSVSALDRVPQNSRRDRLRSNSLQPAVRLGRQFACPLEALDQHARHL